MSDFFVTLVLNISHPDDAVGTPGFKHFASLELEHSEPNINLTIFQIIIIPAKKTILKLLHLNINKHEQLIFTDYRN